MEDRARAVLWVSRELCLREEGENTTECRGIGADCVDDNGGLLDLPSAGPCLLVARVCGWDRHVVISAASPLEEEDEEKEEEEEVEKKEEEEEEEDFLS